MEAKKIEVFGSVDLLSVDMKSSVSPFSSSRGKGGGLKKWRRIKREENKGEEGSIDIGIIEQDASISGLNSSKQVQVFSGLKPQSEDSDSSTKATVRDFNDFSLLDDAGLAMNLSFSAGTDIENSDEWSNKSSTTDSFRIIKGGTAFSSGFSHDKRRMKNLSGKNLSMLRGLLVNGRTETDKKRGGERVKTGKEISNAGMEPGSQSSNFGFPNGTYSSSIGVQNETLHDYDEEKDGVGQGRGHQARNVRQSHLEDVYGVYSSSVVKEERRQNAASFMSMDPLAGSVFFLQSAHEALQKELLSFKEIGKDFLVDPVQGSCFTDTYQNLQATSSKLIQFGDFPLPPRAEVLETANKDAETETDIIFMKKIEVTVEYLVISRMIQTLWVAAIDQISVFEEQKNLASRQAKLLNKLADTEKMITKLEKEAEKLETLCADMASADETLKLQKRVCKYTSFFLVQLVLLVVVLGIIMHHVSPNGIGLVPT